MLSEIKKKIDSELKVFSKEIDKKYSLNKISPFLYQSIREFILRDGKRIRPILFVVGYLGFKAKAVPGLYTSALAIELLHDFLLVHDDIIDKSDSRRGKPSMHVVLNSALKGSKEAKFNGQDLAIVVGDVMYAMAIHAFLSIKEDPKRKEKALKKFIESAMNTGAGEFIELLNGIKDLGNINKDDILKVYDYKTAFYTFACPLILGATLAGASEKEVQKLSDFGVSLGRAFQIKDDIIGMFDEEAVIGKSAISDLQEAKRTLLIYYAYKMASASAKKEIKRIFLKKKVSRQDLLEMRRIITLSGALDLAKKDIEALLLKAQKVILSSRIKRQFRDLLRGYSQNLLKV